MYYCQPITGSLLSLFVERISGWLRGMAAKGSPKNDN